ncbi:hypothetical protein SHKM778_11680 [Streptomyces sp. KM77-8]|uniref:Hemerythrin-like domain-containing protein n=1 Tax=Streptomyces haneummycinicus TaxID=3074435 RepID=A0AAT9HBT8_9ACTN
MGMEAAPRGGVVRRGEAAGRVLPARDLLLLTRIGDVRRLDFIRAFDQLVEETAADRDAGRLLPKAVRQYCAIMAHHLAEEDRFEPAVAGRLRTMSAAALRRLPQDLLTEVLETMDMDRADRLRRLRRRAGAGKGAA